MKALGKGEKEKGDSKNAKERGMTRGLRRPTTTQQRSNPATDGAREGAKEALRFRNLREESRRSTRDPLMRASGPRSARFTCPAR